MQAPADDPGLGVVNDDRSYVRSEILRRSLSAKRVGSMDCGLGPVKRQSDYHNAVVVEF
jgi:hypothetical protein